jgi:cold shock CspA family protein
MTGIVVSFNGEKGYGFLQPLVGRPNEVDNVYFHVSAVCTTPDGYRPGLPNGAEVDFVLVRGTEGHRYQAAQIRLKKVKADVLLQPPLEREF